MDQTQTSRIEIHHSSIDLGPVDVQIGEKMALFDVQPGERRWQEMAPGETQIVLHRKGEPCAAYEVAVEAGTAVTVRVEGVSNSLLGWITGAGSKVRFRESREALPPREVTPPRRQQIWIGRVTAADAFMAQMADRDEFYTQDNFDAEGTPEHIAMSGFAEVMGEVSYDHGLLEHGMAQAGLMEAETLAERFAEFSDASVWGPWAEAQLAPVDVAEANAVILFGVDASQRFGEQWSIRKPRDFPFAGGYLKFIGEFEYPEGDA